VTKLDMARKMGTSRPQLDRVLDPSNVSVQLDTLIKSRACIGKEIQRSNAPAKKGGGLNGARGRHLPDSFPK